MKYLNIDWLYSFKKLAETGNFNIASNELNITVQTLSYHIRCLENHFNIILIERGQKNNVLTFEGKFFLGKSAEFIDSLENTKTSIKVNLDAVKNFLNIIQSTDCNFDYCISNALYKLHEKYQDLKVINQSVLFFELEENISIYTSDFLISSYPVNNKNFSTIKIVEIPYVIAAKEITKNWRDLDYIVSEYHLMRTNHKSSAIYDKYNLKTSMSVSTMSVAVTMAKRNLGAVYLPILDIEKEIIAQEMEFILSPENEIFEVYLSVNNFKSEEPFILEFIDILKNNINDSLAYLIKN